MNIAQIAMILAAGRTEHGVDDIHQPLFIHIGRGKMGFSPELVLGIDEEHQLLNARRSISRPAMNGDDDHEHIFVDGWYMVDDIVTMFVEGPMSKDAYDDWINARFESSGLGKAKNLIDSLLGNRTMMDDPEAGGSLKN